MSTREDDHELARRLADQAGALLLAVREELIDAEPRVRKDAGDARAHEFLAGELGRHRPHDTVFSEEEEHSREKTLSRAEALSSEEALSAEARDDYGRLSADRVWIVDPLDGTREFGEPGRTDWAVHVALWEHGELAAGAVALPAQGATLATPEVAAPPAYDGQPRVVVSRTRAPAVATAVCERLAGRLVTMGSAGAKAMAVVQGLAEVYVHSGGQYEWDSAAPVAVARAAGLHTSRIDGGPLRYNRPDPLLPDLLICRPEYADAVLAVIAAEPG
ncbi:MAG: 3'(2'),5'-bisphosphate nucleotidase CysQ [Pseudonocardia sp.]